MSSPTRVPKPYAGHSAAAQVTASEAKNGFGRVLERVAREGAVVITRHDRPDAVILSIDAYDRLASARQPDVDALTSEFDALYERLQQPGMAEKIEAVFALSPAKIGRIAVERASKPNPKKQVAAKRIRRSRG